MQPRFIWLQGILFSGHCHDPCYRPGVPSLILVESAIPDATWMSSCALVGKDHTAEGKGNHSVSQPDLSISEAWVPSPKTLCFSMVVVMVVMMMVMVVLVVRLF